VGVDSDFLSYCFGLSIDEQFEGLSTAREREKKNMNLFICIFGFLCIVDVYFNGFLQVREETTAQRERKSKRKIKLILCIFGFWYIVDVHFNGFY
jgi:hypothetical protein